MAQFTIKDPDTVRDDILRTEKNGYIQRGILNPSIGYGSDAYITAQAIANELSVVAANTVIKADEQMPDTATGTALDRLLVMYGLARRNASGSYGNITFSTSSSILVPAGTLLIDTSGNRYSVSIGATYANNGTIPINAVDGGKVTNHIAGDVLRWVAAPAYAAPTAVVASGGLTGGVDSEDDETARARLLSRLQSPPGGGNWQQVVGFAEASDNSVQKGFANPALNGPSTVHVAVAGYATSVSKSRQVSATTLAGKIAPYIIGQIAEYAEVTVTNVHDVNTNVAIGLTLPSATTASPPGPGGGWLDGTPWPNINAAAITNLSGTVKQVLSSTELRVYAPQAPSDGISRICYLDHTDWTLYTATIIGTTTNPATGEYIIHLDTPWPTVAIGNYIFPQSTNQQLYVDAILSAFAMMGPGEKTSNASALARAQRKPLPQLSWPYSLGATQLRTVTDSDEAVLDIAYLYKQFTTPAIPAAITDPPNILIPYNIGFYPL